MMSRFELTDIVTFIVGCLTTVVVILGIAYAIVYGIHSANLKYYDAMQDCVIHNGTFLNTSNGAACVIKQ